MRVVEYTLRIVTGNIAKDIVVAKRVDEKKSALNRRRGTEAPVCSLDSPSFINLTYNQVHEAAAAAVAASGGDARVPWDD